MAQQQNISVSQFNKITDNVKKTINPIMAEEIKDVEYKDFVNVRQATEQVTTDQYVGGLTSAYFKPADGSIPLKMSPIQGFRKSYTQQEMTAAYDLTRQTALFAFGVDGTIGKSGMAKISGEIAKGLLNLSQSIKAAKEQLVQQFLLNSASATFTFSPIGAAITTVTDATTPDGVPAWSNAHIREDGGLGYSTVLVSGAVTNPLFSIVAMQDAHILQSLKKDMNGLPIGSELSHVVTWKGTSTAQKVRQAIRQLKSDIQLGSFADKTLIDAPTPIFLKAYSFSGSDTAWGMFDKELNDKEGYGLQMLEFLAETSAPDLNQPGGSKTFEMFTLFTAGWGDVRPWIWSTGKLV